MLETRNNSYVEVPIQNGGELWLIQATCGVANWAGFETPEYTFTPIERDIFYGEFKQEGIKVYRHEGYFPEYDSLLNQAFGFWAYWDRMGLPLAVKEESLGIVLHREVWNIHLSQPRLGSFLNSSVSVGRV
jgi:hypothetical protein